MFQTSTTSDNNRHIALWLFMVCVLIYCMVVLGGVTRLTRSGLSMVEWEPIMGIIPPLNQTEWLETFDKYKQSPEFQKINVSMDLEGFKSIFYYEYAHRVLGRLIGLAFLIPFLYFLLRRKIERRLTPQMILMFILGGMQGLLGWYMVKSGLVHDPHVSQYRLTAHLSMAFIIYSYILWVALGLIRNNADNLSVPGIDGVRRFAWLVTITLSIMIISGGFVAGTKAGFAYGTFPLMAGKLIPSGMYDLEPWYMNLFENITTIQFNHRIIAYILMIMIPLLWWRVIKSQLSRRTRITAHLLLVMLAIQVALGISTLVMHVPVALGAAHQGGALLLLTVALVLNHDLRRSTGP